MALLLLLLSLITFDALQLHHLCILLILMPTMPDLISNPLPSSCFTSFHLCICLTRQNLLIPLNSHPLHLMHQVTIPISVAESSCQCTRPSNPNSVLLLKNTRFLAPQALCFTLYLLVALILVILPHLERPLHLPMTENRTSPVLVSQKTSGNTYGHAFSKSNVRRTKAFLHGAPRPIYLAWGSV